MFLGVPLWRLDGSATGRPPAQLTGQLSGQNEISSGSSNSMAYTLAEAAQVTGLNRSTILRSIKAGRLSGLRDELGQWRIEAAELHRVYAPAGANVELRIRLALADERLSDLKARLDDTRQQRDRWQPQAERLALLAYFPHRIDAWTDDGENIVEHLAGVEDFTVAQATYWAACERWPNAVITLRQGARVVEGQSAQRTAMIRHFSERVSVPSPRPDTAAADMSAALRCRSPAGCWRQRSHTEESNDEYNRNCSAEHRRWFGGDPGSRLVAGNCDVQTAPGVLLLQFGDGQ